MGSLSQGEAVRGTPKTEGGFFWGKSLLSLFSGNPDGSWNQRLKEKKSHWYFLNTHGSFYKCPPLAFPGSRVSRTPVWS